MKTSLLLIGLFTLNVIQAQNDEKSKPTGYISINGGFGLPLGDFSDENVGGASSGGCFNLNFSAPLFKSNFGLTTKIDMGVYEMSATPFLSEQKSILTSFGYKEGKEYDFKTISYGSYSTTNIMSGLYTTIPMKKLSIDARILLGFNFTNRPETTIDFSFYSYNETYYERASSSSSFAYDFGFGLRYNLGKKQKLCLMLSFDYVGTNGDFSFNSKRLYLDATGSFDDVDIQKIHANYSISTWNTTFGIGYVFGTK